MLSLSSPFRALSALALAATLAACSGEVVTETTGGAGASGPGSTGAGTTSSSTGGDPGAWTTLIDGTWSLPASHEGYWCSWKTIQQDTYVKAFRALSPPGTHHTLLIQEHGSSQPDGEAACGPTLGADMLTASGVGTDDLTFPPGVGALIPAGTQLMLNLHLFNTTSSPINGVSGTLVQTVTPDQVEQVAELVLPGSSAISVPPNGTQTVVANCTFPTPAKIITVWPHMHKLGTHMKVTYEGASTTKVLHDAPFTFGDQKNDVIDPVNVAAGEHVRIECTYHNTTAQTVGWGDSSNAEMCFAGLYVYPKLVPGISCQ